MTPCFHKGRNVSSEQSRKTVGASNVIYIREDLSLKSILPEVTTFPLAKLSFVHGVVNKDVSHENGAQKAKDVKVQKSFKKIRRLCDREEFE